MLDQPASSQANKLCVTGRPRLDLQDHLADLEAQGLLVRIERAINKDTELHPLVRWQFLGGVPEDKRRAFLFTHVTDAKRRRYDIPVVVGALAPRPTSMPSAWASRSPRSAKPGCGRSRSDRTGCGQRATLPGDRAARRRPESAGRAGAAAGAGVDPGLRLRSHGDALHHPRSRQRHPEHGHLSGGPEGIRRLVVRMGRARRAVPAAICVAEVSRAARAHADRDRDRLRAGGDVHQAAEARHRPRRAGSPARSPARRSRWPKPSPSISTCPRRRRSSSRADRPADARARRRSGRVMVTWRSRPTTCRCG